MQTLVADMLRKSGKPVILVVNKVDNFDKFMPDVYEFYNLGIGEPHPVSASSKLGLGDMLDAVWELVDAEKFEEEEDDRPKIAIVGKTECREIVFDQQIDRKRPRNCVGYRRYDERCH